MGNNAAHKDPPSKRKKLSEIVTLLNKICGVKL